MSSQNNQAQDVTPDPAVTLTTSYDGWESRAISAPGVPGGRAPDGSSHLEVMFDFAFVGESAIEVIAEHAEPLEGNGGPGDWYPVSRLNSSGQLENDTIQIVLANLEAGQVRIDAQFSVPASHWIRFRARGIGGSGGTLAAKVLAGRA